MLIKKNDLGSNPITVGEAVKNLVQSGVLDELTHVLDLALYSIIQSPRAFSHDERVALVCTHITIKNCVKTIFIKGDVPTINDFFGSDQKVETYLRSLELFHSCVIDLTINLPSEARNKISHQFKSFADLINALRPST